jgi:hypothetical protein
MRRRIARSFFILLCGAFATVVGVVAALLFTNPGRDLLIRLVSDQAGRFLRGSLQIGSASGSWLDGFTLHHVVIRDTAGLLLVSAPAVRVRYNVGNLLAGRFVLSGLRLEHPEMQIFKHRKGPGRDSRTNLEEVFRLNEEPERPTGPLTRPPLVEIRNVEIEDGTLLIRLPWDPDGRLRTAGQIDSALAAQRAVPGRRIESGPEGLELVRTIRELNSVIPLLRLSSPGREPITAVIGALAARISDPELEIRNAEVAVQVKDDSLLFQARRIELPGTRATGEGRIDWPRDTILYRVRFDAPQFALADLRFISPLFPPFTGRARVTGTSVSGARTEWDIRDLVVGDSGSRVSGRLVAIADLYRGLGFRGLRLTLENLDLDVPRAYLDTLPFHGRVTGSLAADGFFDRMTVTLDWQFDDALVPDGATSHLALAGPLRLGPTGLVFENDSVRSSDIDLRTVRVQAPAVTLLGRLAAQGVLNGPLDNAEFHGVAVHRDGERPPSRLTGLVRLDTRGEFLGIHTDVVLDSLVFAGLAHSFPALDARGALGGPVKLDGTLDHLEVALDVGGSLGKIRAAGAVTLLPPRWGADSLQIAVERLDLSGLMRDAPASRLTGQVFAQVRADSGAAPVGTVTMDFSRGMLAGFGLDSTRVRLHAADSLIVVDTLVTHWSGGRLDGHGTLGWQVPRSGEATFHLEATSLAAFDSLALAATGLTRDTTPGVDPPLRGTGRADVVLSGALPALTVQATAVIDSLGWLGFRGRALAGELRWSRGDSNLVASVTADSLAIRRLRYSGIAARVAGRPDSLAWTAGFAAGDMGTVQGGGGYQHRPGAVQLSADSLNLALVGRTWFLEHPLVARITDSLIAIDTVRLATRDGSGSVEVSGDIPRQGSGAVSARLLGVELRDIYGLVQRDTAGVAGFVAADARLHGTARNPELRGSGTLTGAKFGDFHAPLIRTAFDYRDHLLQANLTFWRTGAPVVEVDARLPLDLALSGAPTRQLPGPLSIVARGDSVDLAVIEAFTPNLRRVNGLLDLDARIEGEWDTPRLAGWVRVRGGAATVPDLGVRYQEIGGTIRLSGDSVTTEGLHVGGRFGGLDLQGGLRLERLTRPILSLGLVANDFEVMNVPDFMAIRSSGDLHLTGPLLHPVLAGRGRITNSVIYFADLVEKNVVNLEDPLFADLVDTLALRRYDLGAAFQSRFLDSLAIRDLRLEIGEGVWLRSSEANFQLEGSALVNKVPLREGVKYPYRLDGDLNVPRGTYTLRAGGVINRTFTVERGTVRYFGDLNADLDIQARHVVRAPQRGTEDIPVIVHITGTLELPKLTLTTPPDRPPMSQDQLLSLLAVGTTDPLALGTRDQQAAFLRSAAMNALASELQRALVSNERAPFDLLEIRPGVGTGGGVGNVPVPTQLAVGRALTGNLFVTANAGFCLVSGQPSFNARNLGATLEYRFNRELRGQLSAEPIQTCLARGVDIFGTARRYQFGAELRWDRGY